MTDRKPYTPPVLREVLTEEHERRMVEDPKYRELVEQARASRKEKPQAGPSDLGGALPLEGAEADSTIVSRSRQLMLAMDDFLVFQSPNSLTFEAGSKAHSSTLDRSDVERLATMLFRWLMWSPAPEVTRFERKFDLVHAYSGTRKITAEDLEIEAYPEATPPPAPPPTGAAPSDEPASTIRKRE